MKIRTQFQDVAVPDKGEVNNLPSRTVPNQSMTVIQIMQRFAAGLPVDGQKVQMWEESEMPDLNKMDLSEKFDLLRANQAKINMLKDQQVKQAAKQAQEKLRKQIEQEVRAANEKKEQPNNEQQAQ